MKILVIDNYDSFTYNLVDLILKVADADLTVVKNDELHPDDVMRFDKLVLSPGPGLPSAAGRLNDAIRKAAGYIPVLGVCLGHQAIGEVFGAKLINLPSVFHGLARMVIVEEKFSGKGLFTGLPRRFASGRYHSWVISNEELPDVLEVTARDEDGNIMAIQHRHLPLHGLQFHPESILTAEGEKLMANWMLEELHHQNKKLHTR